MTSLRALKALPRYQATATLAATGTLDGPLFLMDYVLRLLRVAILLAVWRTILAGQDPGAGMSLHAVLTYTLVSAAFGEQLAARGSLDLALWNGSIAMRLLQPMSLAGQFAATMAGEWWLGLGLFTVPLLVAAPLLGVDPRPASPVAAPLFVVSVALGVAVSLALEFITAAAMVTFNWSVWDVQRLRTAVQSLLSGSLVPLALFPWGLGRVFEWLPFASIASAPLRIYTGTGDPLPLLLLQGAWAVVLWPLGQWLWRASREKVVVYGG